MPTNPRFLWEAVAAVDRQVAAIPQETVDFLEDLLHRLEVLRSERVELAEHSFLARVLEVGRVRRIHEHEIRLARFERHVPGIGPEDVRALGLEVVPERATTETPRNVEGRPSPAERIHDEILLARVPLEQVPDHPRGRRSRISRDPPSDGPRTAPRGVYQSVVVWSFGEGRTSMQRRSLREGSFGRSERERSSD